MHFNGYSASVLSSIAMETCNHQSSSLQPRKSKANHANSVRNIHYSIQHFERHRPSSQGRYKLRLSETGTLQFKWEEFVL